ncbi:MAG TPA: EI24 domain-containing protein, partial [Saprospiraceae bacterium]|nr:EI24 domain-containing protein [Saprospiraceae bacterium]
EKFYTYIPAAMGTYNGMSGFGFTASAARTVRINMRNMLKELSLTGILFIGGLIPGLNIIVLILLFLVQSYFAGFGIMDFYLERHYTYRESVALVYKQKWAAIALGAIFTLLFLRPIVGVLV